jgi:hypothetical protein
MNDLLTLLPGSFHVSPEFLLCDLVICTPYDRIGSRVCVLMTIERGVCAARMLLLLHAVLLWAIRMLKSLLLSFPRSMVSVFTTSGVSFF